MNYTYQRKRVGYWNDEELLEFFEQSPKEEILHFLNYDMKILKNAGNAFKLWEVIYDRCGLDLYEYDSPEAHEMYRWMAEVIGKTLQYDIIDIGSSFGIYWKYVKGLHSLENTVTLFDISEKAMQYAEDNIIPAVDYPLGTLVGDLTTLNKIQAYSVFSMNTLDLVAASARPGFQRCIQNSPEVTRVLCGGNMFPGINIRETVGGRAFKHNFPVNLVHPNTGYDYGKGKGISNFKHLEDFFYTPKTGGREIALSLYERV